MSKGKILKNNRVGIFIYGYGLGNSPSMINTGNTLASKGFEVDYYIYKTFVGDFKFNNPSINLYEIVEKNIKREKTTGTIVKKILSLPIGKWLESIRINLNNYKNKILDKVFFRKRMAIFEEAYLNDIQYYVEQAENVLGEKRYNCFFGVEPGGLMAAVMIGKKRGISTIYYNMELRHSLELQTICEKVTKKYEKKYNKFSAFTITLDDERAEIIKKEHEIEGQEILIVPVCAEGPPFREKSDWLRKKYNVGDDQKIILYAGFLNEWAMSEDLALEATSWPDDRILILHSHGYHDENYIKKLRKYEGSKVKISLDPVPYRDLASFLASADIGVALYKNLGKNFTLISSASGKLAHYLKSGLPVIVDDYPSMKKLVDNYDCGKCVNSPQELSLAIDEIYTNYELRHLNALHCYEDNFVFSMQFSKVLDKIMFS